MIFVTVGTHRQGFERLVKAADELAAEIHEPVIIQRGYVQYEPRFAQHFQWASSEQMEQFTRDARVLITHAAAGAIILAMQMGKPIIVVPRLKRYKEHGSDHQQQIARALSAQGRAVMVNEPSGSILRLAVEQVTTHAPVQKGQNQLVIALQEQLSEWEPVKSNHRTPTPST